jgi:predicted metal-dependent HD superfamily phosphohydrolase
VEAIILNIAGFSGLEALPEIRARYSEPGRFYHTWGHAIAVLGRVNYVCEAFSGDDLAPFTHADLRRAALLHDVIYDVTKGSPRNEQESAAYAATVFSDPERCQELILATAEHGKPEAVSFPLPVALFLDSDLAFAFAEERWESFEQRNHEIEQEYMQHFGAMEVRRGRLAFLQRLQGQPHLFLTEYFRERFEAKAREHLGRLIETYEG